MNKQNLIGGEWVTIICSKVARIYTVGGMPYMLRPVCFALWANIMDSADPNGIENVAPKETPHCIGVARLNRAYIEFATPHNFSLSFS